MLGMCQPLLLQPNQSGDTALHLAARHGRAEIVQVLIQAAKVRHGDLEEGISSREACHQFLIRRTKKEKNTALHEAVRFNHFDVVKKLTEEDPGFLYSANDAGETPLYMAAERGHTQLVSKILDTCTSPSYQGPKGLTALHIAAIYGDEEITKRLLETERALAKAPDVEGRTPLHMAAITGNVSIVKQILECDKSTAYIGDNDKSTPVHYAAHKMFRFRCGDVLKQLYFYSPDSFELVDDKGRNALHIAIINNDDEAENFVREDPWLSSVMLNGKDSAGNTPLHQIAISESYLGLEFISDSRVDKMAFNKENMNALNIGEKSTDRPWRRKLREELTKSGARWGWRLQSIRENSGGKEVVDVKKGDRESNFKDLKESHLVVSALIATVTFAAGFTVPGGYVSEQGPNQGHAVLSRNAAFKTFVITNTLAMSLSSCAIVVHFCMLWRRKEITVLRLALGPYGAAIELTVYAMVAMVVAFVTGTYAVLGCPSSLGLAIEASVLGCVFFFGHGAFLLFLHPDFSSWRRFQDFIWRTKRLLNCFCNTELQNKNRRLNNYMFSRSKHVFGRSISET
uniref:ankyrin repeat-containing protein At5g02620-like n=1 Tax=Fragaria vesca subsp. vesca TaxID=101020 RepID=UPI0005C8A494|nr:PREDICTED: ankyrin repeat-containing protein At5g02620-like [Fragaria vesca subsp. vesca]XP_011461659.1 PREDICTED: ankyrin repeat-containing protein At5g02620-like [Fragaria vesca subsp. vesca]